MLFFVFCGVSSAADIMLLGLRTLHTALSVLRSLGMWIWQTNKDLLLCL